jgi:HlyD family secretion protein
MAKSKNRGKYWLLAAVLVVALAVTAGVIYKKREVPVTVRTDKVERHNLTESVVANGKIQPVVQVKISPEVSGEIIELPVKEGQTVKKGDLLVKIKPDFYVANRNQAEASYKSALAGTATAEATLHKAEAEFKRSQELLRGRLVSESVFDEMKANYEVAQAQVNSAQHQAEMARASLDSAEESLSKTSIASPLAGVVTKLNSELGERVLGTIQNVGTEIMTVSDLSEMEARVDIGEVDVVLIKPEQNVRLEVDAFKDRKFKGVVTEIANSSAGSGTGLSSSSASSQEATKFGVKIRIKEKESFRPGMSCTAEIETRSRTNVLTVPIASVTTRLPKKAGAKDSATNAAPSLTSTANAASPTPKTDEPSDKKNKENSKPIEVVFVMDGDHVKMVPVKIGISDDAYWEIADGLKDGQEVVSGNYHVISRELEDGKKVKKDQPGKATDKDSDSSKAD